MYTDKTRQNNPLDVIAHTDASEFYGRTHVLLSSLIHFGMFSQFCLICVNFRTEYAGELMDEMDYFVLLFPFIPFGDGGGLTVPQRQSQGNWIRWALLEVTISFSKNALEDILFFIVEAFPQNGARSGASWDNKTATAGNDKNKTS